MRSIFHVSKQRPQGPTAASNIPCIGRVALMTTGLVGAETTGGTVMLLEVEVDGVLRDITLDGDFVMLLNLALTFIRLEGVNPRSSSPSWINRVCESGGGIFGGL